MTFSYLLTWKMDKYWDDIYRFPKWSYLQHILHERCITPKVLPAKHFSKKVLTVFSKLKLCVHILYFEMFIEKVNLVQGVTAKSRHLLLHRCYTLYLLCTYLFLDRFEHKIIFNFSFFTHPGLASSSKCPTWKHSTCIAVLMNIMNISQE